MEIIKDFLTPNEYSRPTTKRSRTTKLAIHYVGNSGSSAKGNRNYFESLKDKKVYASSHYLIGLQGEIIQCIPEDEIAYTTYDANYYSIGVECCHPKDDGVFAKATYDSAVWLFADMCKRYKLNPFTDIIRHYDVPKSNGWRKPCPKWFVDSPQAFEQFKRDVANAMKPQHQLMKIKVNVFGEIRIVDAVFMNGSNYCKLRDLQCPQLQVGYQNGTIFVNGQGFKPVDTIVIDGNNFVKLQELNKINNIRIMYDDMNKMPVITGR